MHWWRMTNMDELSDDSRLRLERNPLRILDSKNEGDRDVLDARFYTTILHPPRRSILQP